MLVKRLEKSFYRRDTKLVAKELLGKILYRKTEYGEILSKIVETEAYLSCNDESSHSYIGKTKRNSAMFEEGGIVYVYNIYGMYQCLNIVTSTENKGEAVLIRAVEPISGIEIISNYRKVKKEKDLTNGPSKLCQALNITIEDNFQDLITSSNIFLMNTNNKEILDVVTTTRVGITKSVDLPLRFYIKGNKFVSKR